MSNWRPSMAFLPVNGKLQTAFRRQWPGSSNQGKGTWLARYNSRNDEAWRYSLLRMVSPSCTVGNGVSTSLHSRSQRQQDTIEGCPTFGRALTSTMPVPERLRADFGTAPKIIKGRLHLHPRIVQVNVVGLRDYLPCPCMLCKIGCRKRLNLTKEDEAGGLEQSGSNGRVRLERMTLEEHGWFPAGDPQLLQPKVDVDVDHCGEPLTSWAFC